MKSTWMVSLLNKRIFWIRTTKLRWRQPEPVYNDEDFYASEPVLEQLWINWLVHKLEWRSVPTAEK